MPTQREIASATFLAFADIIEQLLNASGEIKKGSLKSNTSSWKILGVTFAASYFKNGMWRFGGLHNSMESSAIALLRAVSQDLTATNTSLSIAISSQQAALLPALPSGSKLAIGLEDTETEYNGNLILIDLHDLAAAQIQPNGTVRVKVGQSDMEDLGFNFQGKTLGDWITQNLPPPPTTAP